MFLFSLQREKTDRLWVQIYYKFFLFVRHSKIVAIKISCEILMLHMYIWLKIGLNL